MHSVSHPTPPNPYTSSPPSTVARLTTTSLRTHIQKKKIMNIISTELEKCENLYEFFPSHSMRRPFGFSLHAMSVYERPINKI